MKDDKKKWRGEIEIKRKRQRNIWNNVKRSTIIFPNLQNSRICKRYYIYIEEAVKEI